MYGQKQKMSLSVPRKVTDKNSNCLSVSLSLSKDRQTKTRICPSLQRDKSEGQTYSFKLKRLKSAFKSP